MSGTDREREQRIRERAYFLWQEDGCPQGREDEYWERARELQAIVDNPDAGLLPNPMTKGEELISEQPVEPPEAVENQAEFPDSTADQGEHLIAPAREAWKDAR